MKNRQIGKYLTLSLLIIFVLPACDIFNNPVNYTSFRNRIPANWVEITNGNFPKTDFYGNIRTWPGAPGAVKQP